METIYHSSKRKLAHASWRMRRNAPRPNPGRGAARASLLAASGNDAPRPILEALTSPFWRHEARGARSHPPNPGGAAAPPFGGVRREVPRPNPGPSPAPPFLAGMRRNASRLNPSCASLNVCHAKQCYGLRPGTAILRCSVRGGDERDFAGYMNTSNCNLLRCAFGDPRSFSAREALQENPSNF